MGAYFNIKIPYGQITVSNIIFEALDSVLDRNIFKNNLNYDRCEKH